jgi:CheY-like chemotaxis protein
MPCLIIADLMLPQMDAAAFIRALTSRFGASAAPIVILSGSELRDELVSQEGVVAAIAKPLDIEEIRSLATRYAPATNAEGAGDPPTGDPSEEAGE